jgi:6-phosphogluconolactonase
MRILIGTYTRGTGATGIYATELDPLHGGLSAVRLVAQSDNPSWLLHRGERLLVANEYADVGTGGVSVFDARGGLTLLQQVPSLGADPCHLACAGDRLAVANYSGGTVALYRWTGSGIGSLVRLIRHDVHGEHPRQSAAHPHGVYFLGGELLVTDLGGDRIYRYRPEDGERLGYLPLPAGAGPRHLTGDGAFLVNELDNTVQALGADGPGPAVSTLPSDWRGSSATAEISRRGNRLYVSNRGHDSIAVFGADPKLTFLGHRSSHGAHPRHFLIDQQRRWLLVANRDSNNIVCLPLDEDGLPEDPVAEATVPSPVHLSFWR